MHLLDTVAAGRWHWPSDAELKIPAPLRQVVTTALAPDLNARYQSGRALREALLAAMDTCGLRADRDAFGAWLRDQNQVPDDRPPETSSGTGERRWYSSHRVQAAVDKASLPQQVEMTRPHLTPPLRAMAPAQPVGPPTAMPPQLLKPSLPPIAHPQPPDDWQMPDVVLPAPRHLSAVDDGSKPASLGLLAATTLVWLLAIVLGTLAALIARE